MNATGGIDRGDGPTVLALHGQPGSGGLFQPLIPYVEDRVRLVAPDRPGYGAERRPARGLAANAAVMAELLDELDVGPVTVVAHSWAGGVAVLLARRRPDLVAGLVLVAAACTPDSLDFMDRILVVPGVGDVVAGGGLAVLDGVLPRVRRLVPWMPTRYHGRFLAALPDERVTGARRGEWARQRRSFLVEQRALVEELPQVAAQLGALNVPTTVLCGAWDLVVAPRAATTLARCIPDAELIVLPEAGHFVMRDQPATLAEVIIRHAELGGT